MRKWLIISSVLIIIVLWQAIQLYINIQSNKYSGLDAYIQLVTNEHSVTIQEVDRYHGADSFVVLKAEDDQDTYYFFVNQQTEEIHSISFSDIQHFSEDLKEIVQENHPEIKEFLRVTPAYTGQFTWEFVIKDETDKLQYVYYSMVDGTYQKKYSLLNKT